jgi:hypothetical protein
MGQRHAPAALYPREGHGAHCTGGWVDPRARLNSCGKSRLPRDLIPGPSSPLYRLSYPPTKLIGTFGLGGGGSHVPNNQVYISVTHPYSARLAVFWIIEHEIVCCVVSQHGGCMPGPVTTRRLYAGVSYNARPLQGC